MFSGPAQNVPKLNLISTSTIYWHPRFVWYTFGLTNGKVYFLIQIFKIWVSFNNTNAHILLFQLVQTNSSQLKPFPAFRFFFPLTLTFGPPLWEGVLSWSSQSSPCVSFKKRRCSWLDLWIIPALPLKIRRCSRLGSWIIPHGALKTRRCSRLHLWIVPALSLKNKDVFPIELMDRPRVELKKPRRCSGLDSWITLAFCTGSALRRVLTKGRFSKSDPCIFFLTMLLSAHFERVNVSCIKNFSNYLGELRFF